MTTAERVRIAADNACGHKVPYTSRREARTASSRMRGASLRPYVCSACGYYHLSSMTKTVFRKQVVARLA